MKKFVTNLGTLAGIAVFAISLGLLTAFLFHKIAAEIYTPPNADAVAPDATIAEPVSIDPLSVLRIEASPEQIILLNTEVNETSVNLIINRLNHTPEKKVYLIINSPGGSVVSGAKLIAYIQSSPVEVDTVCTEFCASMAFHIFEAGKKRYMFDRAFLMGHPASGGASGTMPNMLSMLNAIQRMMDRLDGAVAARAGIPRDQFNVMVLNNIWIESPDAVRMRLADRIIFLAYDMPTDSGFPGEEGRRRRAQQELYDIR